MNENLWQSFRMCVCKKFIAKAIIIILGKGKWREWEANPATRAGSPKRCEGLWSCNGFGNVHSKYYSCICNRASSWADLPMRFSAQQVAICMILYLSFSRSLPRRMSHRETGVTTSIRLYSRRHDNQQSRLLQFFFRFIISTRKSQSYALIFYCLVTSSDSPVK